MAIPGLGSRTANDVLQEVSLHLVEPIYRTTLTGPVSATGSQTVNVASGYGTTGQPVLYDGAQLVVDTGTNAEVITITAFNPVGLTITANFAKTHASGVSVSGATFPIQQGTDPIFTPAEMLMYLSRAQNEFLQACPCAFAIFNQNAVVNSLAQSMPNTVVELCRVAVSSVVLPMTSLARSGGVVTATFPTPHGMTAGQQYTVKGVLDSTFNGVFKSVSAPSPTTLTWQQAGANASTTGGNITYFIRLYEVTQQEQFMANRQWQTQQGPPTAFYEDRTGLYRWGLNAKPTYVMPLELLASIRDTDTLTLLDAFLVPDLVVHIIKWNVVASAFSKDGCWQDSQRAQYAMERYTRGVAAVNRYLDAFMPVAAQGGQ